MSKTTAKAQELVRSVLAEDGPAYEGQVLVLLRKYHLAEPDGSLRICYFGRDASKNDLGRPGPIINPAALDRLIALDTSNGKRLLDWILYASGGGEPHVKESERAVDLAKAWVIQNRMAGKGREETDIKPMSRQEAEADWKANEWPRYEHEYYFADEDLAKDLQYPVFGWFREWPGRNRVYERIERAVQAFNMLLKDRKLVASWNKTSPKEKLMTDMGLAFWEGDQPRYKDVDALAEFVSNIRTTLARHRAEQNLVTVGKNPEGGYRTGQNEVVYDDENFSVVIPLNAGAALKKGYNDWCISNRSRWEDYFKSKQKDRLFWAGSYYDTGPFAFFSIKKPTGDPYLRPGSVPAFAAHAQLTKKPGARDRFAFWDQDNKQANPYADMVLRLRSVPGAKQSLDAALQELEAWLAQFKEDQRERYPSLESIQVMATALVNEMLA